MHVRVDLLKEEKVNGDVYLKFQELTNRLLRIGVLTCGFRCIRSWKKGGGGGWFRFTYM